MPLLDDLRAALGMSADASEQSVLVAVDLVLRDLNEHQVARRAIRTALGLDPAWKANAAWDATEEVAATQRRASPLADLRAAGCPEALAQALATVLERLAQPAAPVAPDFLTLYHMAQRLDAAEASLKGARDTIANLDRALAHWQENSMRARRDVEYEFNRLPGPGGHAESNFWSCNQGEPQFVIMLGELCKTLHAEREALRVEAYGQCQRATKAELQLQAWQQAAWPFSEMVLSAPGRPGIAGVLVQNDTPQFVTALGSLCEALQKRVEELEARK